MAALVNPQGQAAKTVTLINASSTSVSLKGWMLANRQKNRQPLSGTIEPGATIVVSLSEAMNLSEQGGIITLLNGQGLKVDGVAYTKEQASRDGWTIVF